MPQVISSGTADLVLDTPNTYFTSGDNKAYTGWINFDEMDTGDITILTINVKVLSGDNFALSRFLRQTFQDVDGGLQDPVWHLPIVPAPYGIECILEQTDGTVRDYKWNMLEP